MTDSAPEPELSRARKLMATLLTLVIGLVVWWIVQTRCAPPPGLGA